jgi:uncharacterized membrane protein
MQVLGAKIFTTQFLFIISKKQGGKDKNGLRHLSPLDTMKEKIVTIIFAMVFLLGVMPVVNAAIISDTVHLDDYKIEYSYDSSTAQAGEKFNLAVTVTSEYDVTKYDLQLSLDPDSPFDMDSDEEDWDIGDLEKDQSKSRTFRVEIDDDAESDDYRLDFKFEDTKDDWKDYFDIDVDSNKVDIIIAAVESSPLTLVPDTEDVKLTVNLENQGGQSAKFVKSKLVLPDGFIPSNSYSDSYSIGAIAAESEQDAVFYITVDKNIRSGLYKGKVDLEYEEDNDHKTVSLEFDLPVQGKPQFRIDSVTQMSKFIPGSTSKIKVKITNIGDKTAEETSIKVFERSDNPFTFQEKTYFIGTLEPGDSGTAVLEVAVDKGATPNNYLINAQMRSINDGNVLVSDETLGITVSAYEKTSADYLKLAVIVNLVILSALVIAGYALFRRKKKSVTKKQK